MNSQGSLDGFTTPPMTRADWESACKNEARNKNRSQAEAMRLRAALLAIRDYEIKPEIVYDQFAYERMVESFRDCAREALGMDE